MSSLRSLFENKGGHESGSTAPLNFPAPRSLARHDAAQTTIRASLDIPRPTSPWSSSENVSVPQRLGTPSPPLPLPLPRRPNSRLLHRPLSTTALSEPRSPPFVTVESPKSPRKPPRTASTQAVLQSSLAKPLTPGSIGMNSPRMAPVPPKRLSRISTPDSQLSLAECKDVVQEPGKSSRGFEDHPPPTAAKSFPPPVNRADKPKIPTKPISITTSTNKVNLGPLATPVAERVSPFSTPPSSDESVRHGSPVHPALNRIQTPQVKANKA